VVAVSLGVDAPALRPQFSERKQAKRAEFQIGGMVSCDVLPGQRSHRSLDVNGCQAKTLAVAAR